MFACIIWWWILAHTHILYYNNVPKGIIWYNNLRVHTSELSTLRVHAHVYVLIKKKSNRVRYSDIYIYFNIVILCDLCGVSDLHVNVCKSYCSRPQYCATLHTILCIYTLQCVPPRIMCNYIIEDKNHSRNDTSLPMAFVCIYMFIVNWNNNNHEFPRNKNRARSAELYTIYICLTIARLQQPLRKTYFDFE